MSIIPDDTDAGLYRRLERFHGGEIDLDAWTEFLDSVVALPDELQDDSHEVLRVWGEYLAAVRPVHGRKGDEGYASRPDPAEPTSAQPGAARKVATLRDRHSQRLALWREGDPGVVTVEMWRRFAMVIQGRGK